MVKVPKSSVLNSVQCIRTNHPKEKRFTMYTFLSERKQLRCEWTWIRILKQ